MLGSTFDSHGGLETTARPRRAWPAPTEDAFPEAVGAWWARRLWTHGVVVAGYVAIALVAFWPVLPWSANRLFGDSADPNTMVWFLSWVAHAVAHGQNPFLTQAIFVPHGENLAENASMELLGFVMAPVTLSFGPVVSANLLMVLAMPLSATAALIVLRKLGVDLGAAALGGFLYGYSPYMVGQSLGHLNLTFLPLPPFIVLAVVSIVQRRGSPLRQGALLGGLSAAQFLVSSEVMATLGVVTASVLLCWGLRQPRSLRQRLKALNLPACSAMAVAGVLLAYPLALVLFGPQHFGGATQGTSNPYHNDLMSFIVPGPLQRLSLVMHSLVPSVLAGNASETGGYIGLPLLALLGALAYASRRNPRVQVCLLGATISAVLSLGPYLSVGGHVTPVPLPGYVLTRLPFLENILPARISFELDACLAGALAFAIDGLGRQEGTVAAAWGRLSSRNVAIALVGVTTLVTQFPQWPYAYQRAALLPNAVLRAIPAGDPVALTFPYATPLQSQAMGWQASAGFPFRLMGGYGYHPDGRSSVEAWPDLMAPRGLQQFLAGAMPGGPYGPRPALTPRLVSATRLALQAYDIRVVIVEQSAAGSPAVVELFSEAIGRPQLAAGGFELWGTGHRAL